MSAEPESSWIGCGWSSSARVLALSAVACLGLTVIGAEPVTLMPAGSEPAAVELELAAPDPATTGEARPFRHARHVSVLWPGSKTSYVEVAGDCRGCHDYSHPDPKDDRKPSEICASCHVLDVLTV